MRLLSFLFFFLLPFGLQAQTVSGTVVDKGTGLPLPGVKVSSLAAGITATSDAQGRFTLAGTGGEEFQFNAPGYSQLKRKAPAYIGSVPWKIELPLLSVSLEEVKIKPYTTPYQRDSFERATTFKRILVREKSGVMSPASMLAEKISARQKRIWKFQKDFHRMEIEKFIDSRYSPQLTAELTRLSGDTLAHFMNDNPMPEDFARAATDLEIKMWIRDRYKQWTVDN